jgi:hypothetical protein
MAAAMALMESPAIIMAVLMANLLRHQSAPSNSASGTRLEDRQRLADFSVLGSVETESKLD